MFLKQPPFLSFGAAVLNDLPVLSGLIDECSSSCIYEISKEGRMSHFNAETAVPPKETLKQALS